MTNDQENQKATTRFSDACGGKLRGGFLKIKLIVLCQKTHQKTHFLGVKHTTYTVTNTIFPLLQKLYGSG